MPDLGWNPRHQCPGDHRASRQMDGGGEEVTNTATQDEPADRGLHPSTIPPSLSPHQSPGGSCCGHTYTGRSSSSRRQPNSTRPALSFEVTGALRAPQRSSCGEDRAKRVDSLMLNSGMMSQSPVSVLPNHRAQTYLAASICGVTPTQTASPSSGQGGSQPSNKNMGSCCRSRARGIGWGSTCCVLNVHTFDLAIPQLWLSL
jgi:hypothetical protein